MPWYRVIRCKHCFNSFIKDDRYRSVTCPFCGRRFRVNPENFRVFKTFEEARRFLLKHKKR